MVSVTDRSNCCLCWDWLKTIKYTVRTVS